MHDFEAANSDELELKRGDVALVVPTASVEDQVRNSANKWSPASGQGASQQLFRAVLIW